VETAWDESDRFEFLEKLGEGAMGVIHRAFDRERGTSVAVKVLRRMDAAAVYRFKREFRSLCGLSHPNLVKLYELFSWRDGWCFTMELVDGVDFDAYVTNETGFGFDEARLRDALRQLTAGLGALHSAGKLHGDIKPSNVLIDGNGRVVLCDFGLATDSSPRPSDQTGERRPFGTPSYMSPERARGATLSPGSDWYSVGVMLHQTLHGALPLPVPMEPLAGAPEDLLELTRGLLHREPQDRATGGEILRCLGVSEVHAATASRYVAPFIGRKSELAALKQALSTAAAGTPTVVRLHGPSGIGKSSLTRQFLDDVYEAETGLVLEGRCYEQESVPYKALDTIVDAVSRHLRRLNDDDADSLIPHHVVALAQLFPVLRRVDSISSPRTPVPLAADPNEARRRGVAGLKQLLGSLSKKQPVVISIDDLQWGDRDSADLLAEILRPPDAPRMLLIAAYRSAEAASSPFLSAFVETHPDAIDLPLAPLNESDTKDLASVLLVDDSDAETVSAVVRESDGDPFLLSELVRFVNSSADHAALDNQGITLEDVVAGRIAALPQRERAILVAIAIAARPVSHALVTRVAAAGPGVEEAMMMLREQHLVRSRGVRKQDDVECYHDRIRETAVQMLSADERRQQHERWADELEASNDQNREALAVHSHFAERPDRAAHFAIRAAKQAGDAFAFDRAADLYRWALQLRPVTGRASMQLRERLGTALARAGRGSEAALEFILAAQTAAEDDALTLRVFAAEQMLRAGHLDQVSALLGDILDKLNIPLSSTPRRALMSVLLLRARLRLRGLEFEPCSPDRIDPLQRRKIDACWAVSAGMGMSDTIRAMEFQTRHLLLSLEAGDKHNISKAFAVESVFLAVGGPRTAARTQDLLDRAAEVGAGDPHCVGLVHGSRALRAFQLGEFAEAFRFSELALDVFRNDCAGTSWEVDSSNLFGLWSLYYLGQWGEMSRRAIELRQNARDLGDLFGETGLSIGLPAASWLLADQLKEGRAVWGEVMSRWSDRGFHLQHYWHWVGQCQGDVYAGDGVTALTRAREIWPELRRNFLLRIQAVRVEATDLRGRAALAAAGQQPARARRHLREARRAGNALNKEPVAWARVCGTLLLAGVALAKGRTASALELFEEAENLATEANMAMHVATARWRCGKLIASVAGDELVTSARQIIVEQGGAVPERIVALLAPSTR